MSSPAAKPVANILVVDDMPDNLRLLSRMLTDHGYQVRPVLNGAQALIAAQTQPPDLILLDIMMPMMNGFEVCEQLKADARTQDIPVLFISALSDTENKVTAFTAGGVDYVTKPFQLEEVLARVKTHLTLHSLQQQLRQELIARDSLIADLHAYAHTVAHDLRNPISVALGYALLLEMQGDALAADERHQYLATVTQGLRKLSSIVDELLLLAEVRKQELDVTPLAMDVIVGEALRRVADLAERAGVTVDAPAQWPIVMGYAPWIEEVWVNYLSNALKYGGEPPRIEIGAEVNDGQVRCWVRDHGDGLTAEQQVRLFTPFERLDQARATGHGLGLSIVKRIITKLDGEVGVESPGLPGQGCTFWFTLPAA
jgi:two-component system sensor histidine kinase/response regulator